MPENQKKTPCSKLTKRNPDSKPNSDTTSASDGQIQRPEMAASGREIEISELNSDTTPASDGQIQRPEMTGNGREIEISELTFRQQAALPRIALAKSLGLSADCGIAPPHMAAYGPSFPRKRDCEFTFQVQHLIPYGLSWSVVAEAFARSIVVGLYE